MEENSTKPAQPRQMTFKHAEVEKLVDQLREKNPTLTVSAAIGHVFEEMKKRIDETEETLSKRLANLDEAQEKIEAIEASWAESNTALNGANARIAELEKAFADAQAKVDELVTQQMAVADAGQFMNLNDLPEDAAKYLDDVGREIMAFSLFPSTADWVLFMLHKMQEVKGFIPSSGVLVPKEWLRVKGGQHG